MFEVFGPIARPAPGVLPLLLALAPLLGALAFGDARLVRLRALAALAASGLGAVAFFAWSFRWPAEQRLVVASLGVAARVGELDLGLGVALDPLGAVLALAVSVVAARLVWAQRSRRRIALLCAMASAMQFVVLADGAATLALGFGVAALLGGVLGRVHSAHFVADRAADVAWIGAAAVLFWTLGGSWIDGQYAPELEPRLVVVASASSPKPQPVDDDDERPPPIARGAQSSLSFGGLPGAHVLLDGAWLRDARKHAVVAPFADVPIAAGAHTVRLHVGAGADDYFVPKLDAPANQPTTLALRGATTTFREVGDDLVARDAPDGVAPGWSALARRNFFGVSAAAIVLALLGLGLAARARVAPFAPSTNEPARALAALGAIVVLARLPIGGAAPHAAAFIAGALALASLLAATVALGGRASAILSAEIALAGAGAIAGAPALAVVHASLACVLLARESDGGVALFALAPTRAAFAGACMALPFGGLPAALVLAASGVASWALARRGSGIASGAIAGALALALAVDPRTFGSALEPLASRVLAPSLRSAPPAAAPSLAIFGLTLAIVTFAFAASRRAPRPTTAARALAIAEAPARATSALARAIAAALVELETRAAALVRAADSLVRGVGSLASMADEVALVSPTKHARFALPSERALRYVLVPVAIAAAALFAVPWAS
ncbi:MAG TPA: hypothetical protein VGH28_20610 [Polyangiaceae bacterium]|jgi:hypothetical protein